MTGEDRTTCRACGSGKLSTFLNLGDLPHSDGLLREADLEKPEPRYPLDVAFCELCTLVQILKTVPPEELFQRDYPYYSSFSDALLEHSRKNVEARIGHRELDANSFVVELASNDGYLLQYYKEHGIEVLGIDPAEGPVKAALEKGIPSMCTFFGKQLAEQLAGEGKRADVIHANNVLAHVPDTNGFVQGIGALLKDDGVAVIEVPYVKDLIDHCEFDTIYHEHLCYFSVTALVALFKQNGLSLNHVEHLEIHGGSLRLFVEPTENVQESVRDFLRDETSQEVDHLSYYENFSSQVVAIKNRLNELMTDLKRQGKTLAAYGAAAKGAIMLNYADVGTDLIDFVADKNVHKQGRYMPGVHVPIVDPERVLGEMPDYVLLLPWNFKKEILEQQSEYRSRGGKFIIPIPFPEIV